MKQTLPFYAVILLLFYNAPGRAQGLVAEVPLSSQVQAATLVVEGKVINKRAYWDANHRNIYTVNTIQVYKVFKGAVVAEVEVLTPGGTVDLESEIVHPALYLNATDVGMFLLEPAKTSVTTQSGLTQYRSCSATQGFFQYDFSNNTVSNPYLHFKQTDEGLYTAITNITQQPYTQVSSMQLPQTILTTNNVMAITGFTPTVITGGTKSTLTISGSGFGSTKGSVRFRNPDTGGSTFFTVLDSQILSWSASEIKVEVPYMGGTGNVVVVTASGSTVSSSTALEVSYAEINATSSALGTGDIAYQTHHVATNSQGGYTWQMYTGFAANTNAVDAFNRAFDKWVCTVGVNWVIGANTTINAIAADDVNVIRFDSEDELPIGVVGRCTSRLSGCFVGDNDLRWYISELDINFDDDVNWNYTENDPVSGQYDFESIAVHELGHGNQLGHIILAGELMHYTISNGTFNRTIGVLDEAAATDVHTRSTAITICSKETMTDSVCFLSVDEVAFNNAVKIYPNPTNGTIYIENTSGIGLVNARVLDVSGRQVSSTLLNNTTLNTLQMGNLSKGVYFLEIASAKTTITKKIVLQ